MLGLTQDQISGGARTVLNTLATYLIARGIISPELEGPFVAAGVGIVALAAALYFNRKSAQIAKTAALPEVKTITVTDSKLADTAPANVKAA